jgi:hypothetical protein
VFFLFFVLLFSLFEMFFFSFSFSFFVFEDGVRGLLYVKFLACFNL